MKTSRILLFVALGLLILLLSIGGIYYFINQKRFDKTFSVSTTSYKPYDIKFFHDQVKKRALSFREVKSYSEKDSLFGNENNKIMMIVKRRFNPDSATIFTLKRFASQGHTIVINTLSIDQAFLDSLFISPLNQYDEVYLFSQLQESKFEINYKTSNNPKQTFTYPGHELGGLKFDSISYRSVDNYFEISDIDTLITDENDRIEMLKLRIGSGHIYLSKNTLLFSNYFLLHKENYRFFNNFADEIGLHYKEVIWQNSINDKMNDKDDAGDSKIMSLIKQHPPLQWFFGLLLLGILLFIFNYARPFLRPIPVQKETKNHSEAFIDVISELYWQEGGNLSIAEKLINQFNEKVFAKTNVQLKEHSDEEYEKLIKKIGGNNQIQELKTLIQATKNSEEIGVQTLVKLYEKIAQVTKLIDLKS